MKLKSLVFGAAGLVAVTTGAQAADLLPAPAPAPHAVDYVRICDAFGSGFFYIPGTDSCLRLRGRLRVEVRAGHQDESDPVALTGTRYKWGLRSDNGYFSRARGYWGWDHRTNTDIGLVRAFFRGNLTQQTGGFAGAGLDYAFIQIGGLTVGFSDLVIEPVFGGYTLEADRSTPGYESEEILAQYIWAFGNGFSLGVVAFDETGTDLRSTSVAAIPAAFGVVAPAYGGNRIPAGGAALTYDGSWGSARLSGMVRDIRPAAAYSSDHTFGWGVGGSAEIGVPFGSNTKIGFNAQYADGIMEWLHEDLGGLVPDFVRLPAALGGLAIGTTSYRSAGWSVAGGFTTEVFDRTTFNVTGGYTDARIKWAPDVTLWDAQANLQYRLTSNLVISAEGQFQHLDVENIGAVTTADSSVFLGILRAQLDF